MRVLVCPSLSVSSQAQHLPSTLCHRLADRLIEAAAAEVQAWHLLRGMQRLLSIAGWHAHEGAEPSRVRHAASILGD